MTTVRPDSASQDRRHPRAPAFARDARDHAYKELAGRHFVHACARALGRILAREHLEILDGTFG